MGTGLADYEPERAEVKLKSTTLSVRGLNLPDVSRLIVLHLAEIEQVYAKFQGVKAQVFSRTASDAFFIQIASDFPELISEVISIACDEPDLAAQAAKLPIGAQAMCIHEIVRLSFEEAGGIKNLFASLVLNLRDALPVEVQARLAMMTEPKTEPKLKSSIGASERT